MKKIVIVSVIVVAVFGITFFFIYQTNKLHEESADVAPAEAKKIQVNKEPDVLTPANPEDYGMVVINESNKPRTQEDWDRLLIDKIRDVKSELSAQQVEEVKAKIQEDPQKTQEKLKKIDEAIAKCNEALKKDPSSAELRNKLDRLMMLKSISKELPK